MHDIYGSDALDAGIAEHAEKTEQPERAENEGIPQGPTFVAHESARLVVAVRVLTGLAKFGNNIRRYLRSGFGSLELTGLKSIYDLETGPRQTADLHRRTGAEHPRDRQNVQSRFKRPPTLPRNQPIVAECWVSAANSWELRRSDPLGSFEAARQ